jgi:hypothetical protein
MKPSYYRSSINFRPARCFAIRITLLNKATKSSTLRCTVLSAVCFTFYNTHDYKDAGDRRSGGASQKYLDTTEGAGSSVALSSPPYQGVCIISCNPLSYFARDPRFLHPIKLEV